MPFRSRSQLMACSEPVKFLFFWGHSARPDALPGPFCLSQWFPAPFEIASVCYPTAEHYMMAEKARLFHDRAHLEQILASSNPGQAKALGRKVAGFDSAVWEKHAWGAVVAGNMAKFTQNPLLGEYLVQTGDRVLVESSPQDRIWGIGLPQDDPRAADPAQWEGENLLGFALMEVRAQLQSPSGNIPR